MSEQKLLVKMEEMLAEMTAMRAELANLKTGVRPQPAPSPAIQPAAQPNKNSTRRTTLKRLGLALLGGAATAGVLGVSSSVQAKVVANPQSNGLANRVGMLVVPPGAPAPINSLTQNFTYGLIATSKNTSALDLDDLNTIGPIGVLGISSDTGVEGRGDIGVVGEGVSIGVYGSGDNYGVTGSGNIYGVYGSGDNYGVYGSGNTYGVYASGATGIYGAGATGIYGFGSKIGVQGSGQLAGLFVGSTGGGGGTLPATTTVGVVGSVGTNLDLSSIPANSTLGIYAVAPTSTNNYAGYFAGNVKITGSLSVTGNLTKGGGTFKIDHPLDPTNKYLYHSFVESPDMMNIYNGLATLDEQGETTVEMPDWFEALNTDFRYQLTSIGGASPNLHIAEKISERKFKIAGGLPGQEVSWQVTGIRQDAYAKAHRIPVEEAKTGDEKGKYLHPEAFGQPAEMAVHPGPVRPA